MRRRPSWISSRVLWAASFVVGVAGLAADRGSAQAVGWEAARAPAPLTEALAEAVALWQAHKTEAAIARARSVRDSTDNLVLEGRASLLLGQWLARERRYAEASESLRRHLRTGTASDEEGSLWLGTTLLASGQPLAAYAQFRVALGTAEAGAAADRGLRVARALYGIALAADLVGQDLAVAESLARARQHDREGLVRAACAGTLEPPVLEPEHASYLCLLAGSSKPGALPVSAQALSSSSWPLLAARSLAEPWASRANWHAEAQSGRGHPVKPDGAGTDGPVRIVALAVVGSDGGVSTPVADAALQIAARVRGPALHACVVGVEPRPGTRIGLRARFSPGGRLLELELVRPVGPRWVSVLECFKNELKDQWIVPPAKGAQAMLVDVEMIFGR